MSIMPITGTFIDEMTVDIPSQNWGRAEWAAEFDRYVTDAIDTVILIRCGCGPRLAFPSKTVAARVPTLPVYVDLVELLLDLAAERGIDFYFGLYDSNVFWYRYDWRTEVDLNRELIKEAWDRYGASSAFAGWYLPHETTDSSLRIIDINGNLAEQIRTLTPNLPILVSPFFFGRSDLWNGSDLRSKPREPDEHVRVWAEIFDRYSGLVDHCAFQDGTVDLLRVEEYLEATAAAARSAGISPWVNIEIFDRDMPIKFPPIDWRLLAHKIHAAQRHVDKLISFELAHFMSPHSMWASARHLHQRYREFLGAA
jgi:Domain of unknown function (DUF4434)